MSDLPRYRIELWGGRWYIRGGPTCTPYGPFENRQDAHDTLVEVNTILAEAEHRIQALLQQEAEG